jgi:hypothetical protein
MSWGTSALGAGGLGYLEKTVSWEREGQLRRHQSCETQEKEVFQEEGMTAVTNAATEGVPGGEY